MKENIIDVPFPVGGLVVNVAYQAQPSGTSPLAQNVRAYEPVDGRNRGGQRSGLIKYTPDALPVSPSPAPIQDLNQAFSSTIAGNNIDLNEAYVVMPGYISYGIEADLDTLPGSSPLISNAPVGLGVFAAGDFGYFLAGLTGGGKLEVQSLTIVGSITVNGTYSSATYAPDQERPIGITAGNPYSATNAFVYTATPATSTDLITIHAIDTTGMTLAWSVATGLTQAAKAINPIAYCNNTVAVGGTFAGGVSLYNAATGTLILNTTLGGGYDVLDIATDGLGFFYVLEGDGSANAVLFKIDCNGNQIWKLVLANYKASSVCYDSVNLLAVVCYTTTVSGHVFTLSTHAAATGTLQATNEPNTQGWQCVRFTRLGGYMLGNLTDTGGNAIETLLHINAAFTVLYGPTTYNLGVYGATNGRPIAVNTSALSFTAPPPTNKQVRLIGVCAGTVCRFDSTAAVVVSGGTNALNPGAVLIFSTQVNQQLYFVDGMTAYKYYDCPTDSVLTLTASSGTLPVDNAGLPARLCTTWRNRLILSGLPNDPNNFFGSAVGDPTNWNFNPTPAVETQAFAANASSCGASPDMVNCLIAYNDEVLILGGVSTIYQLTGDPLSGGRIDLVSSSVGMAWGRPFCRDGLGNLYFLSSRGSVYEFVPGGEPSRLSDPISELLLTINFDASVVRMAWDERQRGFHVFITAASAVNNEAGTYHYFYDVVGQSWWQDFFQNANHNPLAVLKLDGDQQSDRVILLGGWDGYIRAISPTSLDDDGTTIISTVTIGPLKDPKGMGATLADLQAVLGGQSSPITWTVQAGNSAAQALGASTAASGTWSAGRNRSQALRVFGHAIYVSIGNANAGQSWQLEYIKARMRLAEGDSRQRQYVN